MVLSEPIFDVGARGPFTLTNNQCFSPVTAYDAANLCHRKIEVKFRR